MNAEGHSVMEFCNSRFGTIVAAFLVACTSVGVLSSAFVANGLAFAAALAVGGFLLLVAILLFSYRSTIRIDRRAKTVESRRETLWWIEHMSYLVSEFGTVHFGIDGSYQNGWSYYVQLVGETTLKIPLKPGLTIRSADKTDAHTLARRVGKYLDLPVVEDA